MKNIIVIAYQCSPYRGSEYSVAWNHIINMSIDNRLTVLYGTSGNHMGDFEEMESYLKNHKHNNITFIPIVPSKITNALNYLNKKEIFNYSFYFAYKHWQRQVYAQVKKLLASDKYDLIHFLSPIGYREPGFLWKIDIPYIWGPIGGAANVPGELFDILTIKGKLKVLFRNVVNSIQLRYSLRLRKALNQVDVLLASTTEVQKIFEKTHNKTSIYIPENCLLHAPKLNTSKFDNVSVYQMLLVGRLDELKGNILFFKALAQIKKRNNIHVNIIGDGPARASLEEFAKSNGLDDIITFYGQLSRDQVLELYDSSHLHIITSLKEGNPTVIWESMGHGVPTLTLDHCGMHDTVCEKCGIKIPVTNSEQIVSDITEAIDNILEHPLHFEQLAHGTIECANKYLWNKRRELMNSYYDLAIERHNQRK